MNHEPSVDINVKNGTNNPHTDTINQRGITTFVEIPTQKMVVSGVIPLIPLSSGSTVLKLTVVATLARIKA